MATNVFLMDCEQRCAEGIVHSVAKHGFTVIGLSAQQRCPLYYSRHVSRIYLSPQLHLDFDAYFQFLVSLPERGVIVPAGDLSVQFLSAYKDKLVGIGYLLNIIDESTLLRVFDKWGCYELCREVGVPVAHSAEIRQANEIPELLKSFEFPAIVKPTRLAGGNYIKFYSEQGAVEAYDQLLSVVQSDRYESQESGLMIQQWIESEMADNWSCEVFYDKHGRCVDSLTIKRIRTSLNRTGSPTSRLYCGTIQDNPELVDITRKVLDSVEWRGIAHVEFIFDRSTGEYLLAEVNPRLPGYSYLLSRTGHEFGHFYAADLVDQSYTVPVTTEPTIYFEALRFPGDISDGLVNAFRGNLSFIELMKTYFQALFSEENVVVEHFNAADIPMSVVIVVTGAFRFVGRMAGFVKRSALKLIRRRPDVTDRVNT